MEFLRNWGCFSYARLTKFVKYFFIKDTLTVENVSTMLKLRHMREGKKVAEKYPEYMRVQTKPDLIKFELNNFDKIVLYNSGGGFWQALDHSCYIMQHIVHNDLIVLKNQIKFDYNYKFEKNVPYTAYNMEQSGKIKHELVNYGFEVLRNDEMFFVLKIPKLIEPETMKAWVSEKEVLDEQIRALLAVGYDDTVLFTDIRKMSTDLLRAMAKFNGQVKPALSARLLELILDLFEVSECIYSQPRVNP